jgi:glycosyltransferase involved in cell wall biosynthesis
MLRILGLPGRDVGHPCTDYRMTYPWRHLAGEAEHKITVVTELQEISQYDIVVFQRQEMPLVEEVIKATQQAANIRIQSPWVKEGLAWSDATRIAGAKRAGKPVVFDIDDDALHVPPSNPNYLQWGRDHRKIAAGLMGWKGKKPAALDKPISVIAAQARANLKQLLKNIATADAVTVTTPWLKRVYSKYNKNIYVLPNWAEPEEWRHVEPKEHEGIHIGWAGGPTHYGDLAVLAKPVIQILKEFPGARLVLCGFPKAAELLFADVPPEQILVHPFMDEWKQNLATWDVILAPSADDKFNAGKSVIRLYEGLMATKGRAAVVGTETTYGEAIRELGCGYVCGNHKNWLRALRRLIKDPVLRKTLGKTGYEKVLKRHTYAAHAREWLDVYRGILNG